MEIMGRMKIVPSLLLLLLASFSLAKDKPPYVVGEFMSSQQVSDGTYSTASCGSFGCNGSAYNAAHNVHLVKTSDGVYSIEAPVSVGGTVLLGMLSHGQSPTVHKAWFMDSLHEGDQVLFSKQCNKHNRCTIRLPNPDKPDKEFVTLGFFFPAIAKTNTTVLCGSGRLTADVEAQVCSQQNPSRTPAPPGSTPPVGQDDPASAEPSGERIVPAGVTETPLSMAPVTPSPGDLAALGLVIRNVSGLHFPMITNVVYRGTGYQAGLQVGYLIVSVNGETTHSLEEVKATIAALPPNTVIVTLGYNFLTNLGYMPNKVSVRLDTHQLVVSCTSGQPPEFDRCLAEDSQ
jgi:hypothetical protein